jgi:hypothetical protein
MKLKPVLKWIEHYLCHCPFNKSIEEKRENEGEEEEDEEEEEEKVEKKKKKNKRRRRRRRIKWRIVKKHYCFEVDRQF